MQVKIGRFLQNTEKKKGQRDLTTEINSYDREQKSNLQKTRVPEQETYSQRSQKYSKMELKKFRN